MMNISPALVFTGVLIAMLLMVVGMCFLARKGGIDGEKLAQAKAETKAAIKQKEIANDQTKIANNAPTSRNDALLNKLSKRSRSNR